MESGSILEDFLESVVAVPVYIKRPLKMIRGFDRDVNGLKLSLDKLDTEKNNQNTTDDRKIEIEKVLKSRAKAILELSDEKIHISQKLTAVIERTLLKANHDLKKLEKNLLISGQISQAEVDALRLASNEFKIPMNSKGATPKKRTLSQVTSPKSFKNIFGDNGVNSKKQKTKETSAFEAMEEENNDLESILSKLPIFKESRDRIKKTEAERVKNIENKENELFKSASLADLKTITSRIHPLSQQAFLKHHHQQLRYTRQLQQSRRELVTVAKQKPVKTTLRKKPKVKTIQGPLVVGMEVAAFVKGTVGYGVTPDESLWILGRVAEINGAQLGSRTIVVSDADSQKVTYKVLESNIVKLVQHEDASMAKGRLPKVNELVFAIYPDSTTFYKCILRKGPHINDITQDLVCLVKFFDDEDETGVSREKPIPIKFVFHRNNIK